MSLKNKVGPLTAVVIASATVTWMVIGGNGITAAPASNEPAQEAQATSDTQKANTLYPVQAKKLQSQLVETHLTLSGKTLVNDSLTLTNGYAGRVTSLPYAKGDKVEKGSSILKIDTRALKTQIEEAELLVTQRKLELEGIKRLSVNNFSSKANLASAETALASAKATELALKIQLENANLTAPFSGILNSLDVEKGQLLANSATVGTIISINPIKVSVDIPQSKIHKVSIDTQANIQFDSGYQTDGTVSYISSVANEANRTISVELLVNNSESNIFAGVTAKVDFILERQKAHAFSPALLTLDDFGNTAVKTLSGDNKVVISPIEIIRSEREQIWVTGLEDTTNIITVGQGFVSENDTVDAHYQN
ncbi:efflux RND transporter periplasmic adaptor subunit [Marinomonas sp. C2222]|uniref:Efflux RND transporter periplasmic adaptor subunit n=1 Tax=Marinomonas sargassi TaxID=2984494 RepID=A0ABT2YSU9_9GAMM|nr:efflux RND transporter periplasmic adaptor subunit [Marinomonas sargassi]MCV2402830.1 efflux RND transporter periplasmic adaptor subunit [Marinomonas sargassi]